jgi:glycosyltransferase involved in cell wall biosynthesis
MKILIVTITYPPEIRAISLMMQELADELSIRGHDVIVVTSWPSMNLLPGTNTKLLKKIMREGKVSVIRVRPLPGYSFHYVIRGISQLIMPHLYLKAIKKYIKEKIDYAIIYSPPLPLALVGTRLKQESGTKILLNIQDIFPQNAIDLGILRNKILIRFFEQMEEKAYMAADYMTGHTLSSTRFLIEHKGVPEEKISTIPNWIDVEMYARAIPIDTYRKQYGLEGKFVFIFAGVIGPSQGVDFILDIAKQLIDLPNVYFLFVGEGSEKKRLIARAQKENISNVFFKPYVPLEEYPTLVKEMDAGLICLSMQNTTPVIPGKLLGFMAASLPVVAFVQKESDIHALVQQAQCGYTMVSDDVERGAELVKSVYERQSELKQYGENGFRYVTNHYSKNVCINKIEELILRDQ